MFVFQLSHLFLYPFCGTQYQPLKCIPLTTACNEKCHILQKAGNSPVISPNLLPACLYYLNNFSAAASKNFTLDQAVPPCANGSIVLTKT